MDSDNINTPTEHIKTTGENITVRKRIHHLREEGQRIKVIEYLDYQLLEVRMVKGNTEEQLSHPVWFCRSCLQIQRPQHKTCGGCGSNRNMYLVRPEDAPPIKYEANEDYEPPFKLRKWLDETHGVK